MNIFFQLILMPFPWFIRKIIYKLFFNFKIDKSCYIGWSIINTKKLTMMEGSRIGHFNIIRNMECVILGVNSIIGTFNWIAGGPTNNKYFSDFPNRCSILKLGDESAIVARHIIDCTDAINIGNFSTIAGHRSQILTHSIDLKKNIQACAPIQIGSYCFLGTGAIVLKGIKIPDYTIIGAGSVVSKEITKERCIYMGNPAIVIKNIKDEYKYFDRSEGMVK